MGGGGEMSGLDIGGKDLFLSFAQFGFWHVDDLVIFAQFGRSVH